MKKITYTPIGLIHSPFEKPAGTPIQPKAAEGTEGKVELFPEYAPGLTDLEAFSHIILIYHFHLSKKPALMVTPFMDDQPHGVFATRAPNRPNTIGLSVVRLVGINGKTLHVKDIDILNGTPLLDIKPFVPAFDQPQEIQTGWLKTNIHKISDSKDDGRFS
jgi:tRNA (adenine37-N6)-methyltransferase